MSTQSAFAFAAVPPLPDICRRRHRGNLRSEQANEGIAPRKLSLRARILNFISERESPTSCEQIETALQLKHQTASARISELKKFGDIVIVGTGKTSTGTACDLYLRVK